MTVNRFLVDGEVAETLALSDRAIQFGDGLFETFRVCGGQVEYLQRHLSRLRAGCQRLQLVGLDYERLQDQIHTLARQTHECVIKLIISRGSSVRGYRVVDGEPLTVILGQYPAPQYPPAMQSDGIRVRVCDMRLARQPLLAGIKHLNRLEQVLARTEWNDESIYEGLLLDSCDQLVEGTMSNLFLVRGSQLYTPDLRKCGVSGILRSVIIDVSGTLELDTRVTGLSLQDAGRADELFVCNSITGILPVRRIDGIGEYRVGPITRRLIQALENHDDANNPNWYSS